MLPVIVFALMSFNENSQGRHLLDAPNSCDPLLPPSCFPRSRWEAIHHDADIPFFIVAIFNAAVSAFVLFFPPLTTELSTGCGKSIAPVRNAHNGGMARRAAPWVLITAARRRDVYKQTALPGAYTRIQTDGSYTLVCPVLSMLTSR